MDNKKEAQTPYRELLFDKKWMEKRACIIKRDGFKCAICGSKFRLVVHHKQYHFNIRTNKKFAPWDYDDKYLVTLCESCHRRGHQQFKIPKKNINR